MRHNLSPGHNVDRVDIVSGLRELHECGVPDPKTACVIEYALVRWARGEEKEAQKMALDQTFHGVDLICWTRVLAAARAAAEHAPVGEVKP